MNIVQTQVENATVHSADVLLDIDEEASCLSEFCRENCSVCLANCNVHRLKRGVIDLVGLLEADFISECEVCVNHSIKIQAMQLRNTFNSITDQLISPTPQNYQCVSKSVKSYEGPAND